MLRPVMPRPLFTPSGWGIYKFPDDADLDRIEQRAKQLLYFQRGYGERHCRIGAGCEYAFGCFFGMLHLWVWNDRHRNVGEFQVNGTEHQEGRGHLLVQKGQQADVQCVLVQMVMDASGQKFETAIIKGSYLAGDAQREDWWDVFLPVRPAYKVPKNSLLRTAREMWSDRFGASVSP
jgi:hypothetical protein